jgi:OmpA-OmpF porin, OOP family
MKGVLACAVFSLSAVAASAQPVSGFYVQGGAGLALPQSQPLSLPPASQPNGAQPSAAAATNAAINSRAGAAQSGSAGWGFGNGLRMEVEGVHTGQGGSTTN